MINPESPLGDYSADEQFLMLICRLFLSSGSLPSALSIILLMFFLQPKNISVHSWFCPADHHGQGWLRACFLRGQLGMEASGAVAKSQSSGLATDLPNMGSPTSVCQDLQGRWKVGVVRFLWQVVDDSEDSTEIQQPVHMSSLKPSMNQCHFIAPAAFRLAVVPVSFLSFKIWVEISSCPQNSNRETLQVDCFSSSSE